MSTSLADGQIFANRYKVVRCIGTGGMGAVYEVIHLETERRRALKVMHAHFADSPDFRERFKREARVAAQIDSDYIVDVFDAGVDDATQMPFLAMELLRGEELARTLKRVGRMAPNDVVTCLFQTAIALDRTHRASIVHRDLKPENIFLCERDDGPPQIKVLDFGIAKFATSASGHATNSVGTPLYMAPEQFLPGAEVTPAADIYALGLVAYSLLVGVDYWHEELERDENVFAFALIAMKGPVEPPSARAPRFGVTLPPGFDAWFAKATAIAPKERFATASGAVRGLATTLRVPLPAAPRGTLVSLHGGGNEVTFPNATHNSRTTPAGSAATLELRDPRPKRRWVVPAGAASLLAVVVATMALRANDAKHPAGRAEPVPPAPAPVEAAPLPAAPLPAPGPTAADIARPSEGEHASSGADTNTHDTATVTPRAAVTTTPKPRKQALKPAAAPKAPPKPVYSRE